LFSNVDLPTLGNPINTTVPSPALLTSKPSDLTDFFDFVSCSRFSFAIFCFQ